MTSERAGDGSGVQAFDLVIIGGGINGVGIARDAAIRGLKTALLEAADFGSGTTSWSTRLIHGGLRYLEHAEIGLVRESLHERTRLRRNAEHLVSPLRITIPLYKEARRGPLLVRLGMMAYDLLSFGKAMPGHDMLSRAELLEAESGLRAEGLRGGARYFDAQLTFAERLVIENVIASREHGAQLRNYCPVTAIEPTDEGLFRVICDRPDGPTELMARSVVNAAGPWVDQVLEKWVTPMPRLMGGTKGSHIVVGKFAGAPADAIYVEAKSDGRPIFIVPWNSQYLIGTTDIRVQGDPGDVTASDAEVDYLISEVNRVFPSAQLSSDDIHFTYAGVRPLPRKEKGPESAITRRHIIRRHTDRAAGVFSIIGGKLTTFRSLAEHAVDEVADYLGANLPPCATRDLRLPGAIALDGAAAIAAKFEALSSPGQSRLVDIYGSRVARLAALVSAEPELHAALDAERTVLAAEVALAVREEYAVALSDILYRRLMVGLSARLDPGLIESIAELAASELDWTDAQRQEQLDALAAHHLRLRRRLHQQCG